MENSAVHSLLKMGSAFILMKGFGVLYKRPMILPFRLAPYALFFCDKRMAFGNRLFRLDRAKKITGAAQFKRVL